jgi:DNA/RNA-binding domain of Phe-tRNA-synthetase-like protein
LTRRWTWRQGQRTLTQLDTQDIEFNVDGLPPTTEDEVEAVCEEIGELLGRFCFIETGRQISYNVLTESHPTVGLGIFR